MPPIDIASKVNFCGRCFITSVITLAIQTYFVAVLPVVKERQRAQLFATDYQLGDIQLVQGVISTRYVNRHVGDG